MHLNLYVSISLPPGPPPAPNVPSISVTNVSFTVKWKEPPDSSEMVDNFTFRITPNDLDCTRDSMTAATCTYDETDWGRNYTYVVSALNCGNQSGNEVTGSIQLNGTYV